MAAAVALVAWLSAAACWACPFCGAVGRSLADRRDAADAVVVGDASGRPTRDPAGLLVDSFAVVATLRGGPPAAGPLEARIDAPLVGTAILFATRGTDGLRWEAIAADEAVIDHVARAPATTEPPDRRLRWFAARLRHPQRVIADDAFTEFGLAAFEDVRRVADAFDPALVRAWLADDRGDQRRRGFHGLLLGIAAASAGAGDRAASIAALRAAATEAGDDLRAGLDGILAGVLVAEGREGLGFLRDHGLLAATTRPGDARHVLAALRFAAESLGDEIPPVLVAEATAMLLENPAVAAGVAIDLARYRRWDELARVAALWQSTGRDDPLVRRAVAGYLEACPLPAARLLRDGIARADPPGWAAASAAARRPGP